MFGQKTPAPIAPLAAVVTVAVTVKQPLPGTEHVPMSMYGGQYFSIGDMRVIVRAADALCVPDGAVISSVPHWEGTLVPLVACWTNTDRAE